jgi:hypothetical protein
MKEIAAEHDVAWDPADTEAELLKSHEDLLVRPKSRLFLTLSFISLMLFFKHDMYLSGASGY